MSGQEQREALLGHDTSSTTFQCVVLAARDGASASARQALEALCQAYWSPLYGYVRRQGHSPQDAEDITQDRKSTRLNSSPT